MTGPAQARIGYMQGRLSPLVDGKIQAFPWDDWRAEFPQAEELRFGKLEWTLDQDRLGENPLMTETGRAAIAELADRNRLRVVSLTGDLFMQAPFWKADGPEREARLADFDAVVANCSIAGIRYVVVPLVDNGKLERGAQRHVLADQLLRRASRLADLGVVIAFESDFAPAELAGLMEEFPAPAFGINYDTGNSAALGFDTAEEIASYAPRIVNVHIKDRLLGGTTVPLGTGAADLPLSVRLLEESGYTGNYILQTARAADGDHAGALARYRGLLVGWIEAARGP